MSKNKEQAGFTLMELVVVVAILAVLAAVLTPRLLDTLNNSRNESAMSSAKQVQVGMERFALKHGTYPLAIGDTKCAGTPADVTKCYVSDYESLRVVLGEFVNLPAAGDATFSVTSYDTTNVKPYQLTLTVGTTQKSIRVTPDSVKLSN